MKLIYRNGMMIGPVEETIKCGKYNLKARPCSFVNPEDPSGDFWGESGLFVGHRLVFFHNVSDGVVLFDDEMHIKKNQEIFKSYL